MLPSAAPVPAPAPAAPAAVADRRALWILAIVAGVSVANLYYYQPLLAAIAQDFGRPAREAGLVATAAQVGYAAGLLFLVPLGDVVPRRRLLLATLVAGAIALLLAGLAPSLGALAGALLLASVLGVAPQIAVPFAASLAPPARRGRAVGTVMTGLVTGILLARVVSGVAGARVGWRVVHFGAAALTLALAAVVGRLLPAPPPPPRMRYGAVLRSIPPLIRAYPTLRRASLAGAMSFGAFTAFWTTLAFFLSGPPWHLGPAGIGAFGIAGLAGVAGASVAGRVADRRGPRTGVTTGLGVLLASWAALLTWRTSLAGMVVGTVLLDLGVQMTHISNQARVYALPVELHSRLNTVYMVSYFGGGAIGSLAGSWAWGRFGWTGVCAAGALLVIVGLVGHLAAGDETPPVGHHSSRAIDPAA